MLLIIVFFFVLLKTSTIYLVELDLINCGIDNEMDVSEGDVDIKQYPWVGIFFYSYHGAHGELRAVTTVALIQAEFVIAPAADIGPIPKTDIRKNSRVLLGEGWGPRSRKVRSYVLHPEYGETLNTIALVQLSTPVRSQYLKPLCPPPMRLRSPDFYVVKFKDSDDFDDLQKQVIPVTHITSTLCRDFYLRTNLYAKMMRPPHVACAVSLEEEICVWNAGAALVTRDVWGRWMLVLLRDFTIIPHELGLGVRGPGCGAPSRYLDMMSYYPWIENSLDKFRRISISQISKQKYVLRGHGKTFQRFGNCDEEEKINLIYRELINLRTDNNMYQFLTYNLTLFENVEFSCLTLELVNASAVSEMRIKHACTRNSRGPPCYRYRGSTFDITLYIMFSDTALFEMHAWGWRKNMTLIDIQEWKHEEGTYYEDFTMKPVEYRGPTHETEFGFEPLVDSIWVPEYDFWSSSPPPPPTTTTAPPPNDTIKKDYSSTISTVLKIKTRKPDQTIIMEYMTGKPNPLSRYELAQLDISTTTEPED